MIIKLQDHKSANCHVEVSDNKIEFISYSTTVIVANKIKGNVYRLICTGLYSSTTRRQIGWFLNEYFSNVNYYDMKAIAYTDNAITTELTKY